MPLTRRELLCWSLWTVASVSAAGCMEPPGRADADLTGPLQSVEHIWGLTSMELRPERIVVLDLPFLDSLTALNTVAVGFAGTSSKELPKYLREKFSSQSEPRFVGERKQPNLELIMALEPQLIVANPDRHKLIKNSLDILAPTIALNDNSTDDIRKMLRTLAGINGKQSLGEEIVGRLDATLAAISSSQQNSPSVLVLGAFEDEFTTWTSESFIGSLLTEAGFRYAFTGPSTASESQTEVAKITVENLSKINPDYLFVYGSAERWKGNPVFEALAAKRTGRVHPVSRDLWSRSRGPIAAFEILAAIQKILEAERA